MHGKLCIHLRERGSPQIISREDWVTSGCISDATELSRLGVVKITQSGSYLLIEPKTLVGIFDSPRLKLEVTAKSPTLSAELLKRIEGWRKKTRQDDIFEIGTASQIESVWKAFETLLSNLHREGLPWSYSRKTQTTSTPRGKILFRETMSRLISRGINHQVVSSSQTRNYYDNFAPALDAVRRRMMTMEAGTPPSIRSKVLRLISLAGDLSIPIPETQANEEFEELIHLEGHPALFSLCLFCMQILDGNEYYRISRKIGSGIAEFVDLEKLWESAVQMLLEQHRSCEDVQVRLHPLRRGGLTLFDDGGPEIDPDIVTYHGHRQHSVVDAKYSIATTPSADDVYQVSSYMSRLNCRIGILAYVSENNKTKVQKIGTLTNGGELFACYFGLDAFHIERRELRDIFPSEIPVI